MNITKRESSSLVYHYLFIIALLCYQRGQGNQQIGNASGATCTPVTTSSCALLPLGMYDCETLLTHDS